ncbi:uncharacterized protein C2845_PM01G18610 [Panicum miliaceum]|uniref:Uncharacterized protein n=1 Tax=Panicum miliaceum TaxID=4540 RepID=A0A3L6TRI4_PANMI|nr:uncharacterized protein C2845_PM01G18610 [Panicum miliaceum]
MDDVWPWLASVAPLPPAAAPDAPPRPWSLPLAASPDGASIVLQVHAAATATASPRSADGEPARLVAFSLAVSVAGGEARALWVSDAFAASSSVPLRLRLLVQLLNEVLALSPYVPCLGATSAAGGLGDDASSEAWVDADVVSAAVGAGGTDASSAPAAAFFSLALLLRLFWLCALDAPADAGYLFFRDLGAGIERALVECPPALGAFLRAVGPDVEERFMRSLGYMLAKWCLLREIQAAAVKPAPQQEVPRRRRALPAACVSYAAEAHGLWVLRGYAPVLAMPRVTGPASASVAASPHEAPEEPALRYGLVHQQLEAVAQLEYAVRDDAGGADDDDDAQDDAAGADVMDGERHFPSRIRIWVGPRFGASYATGPSLGRSTGNPERDVEMTRTVKGAFSGPTKLGNGNINGGVAPPRVKAKMRSSARARTRSWRWEQEAEGSAGVFEGVLCDPVTGTEVSAWRPGVGGTGAGDPRNGMRRRYGGPGRAFSKMRGLVVAGDELPEEMTWRVGREQEGRTLRWRLGLKAWVSYLPNEVRSRHFETRCVEWAHEVELPLVPIDGDESWAL